MEESKKIGIDIVSILKYPSENPHHELHIHKLITYSDFQTSNFLGFFTFCPFLVISILDFFFFLAFLVTIPVTIPSIDTCSRHERLRTEVHAFACTFGPVLAGRIASAAFILADSMLRQYLIHLLQIQSISADAPFENVELFFSFISNCVRTGCTLARVQVQSRSTCVFCLRCD